MQLVEAGRECGRVEEGGFVKRIRAAIFLPFPTRGLPLIPRAELGILGQKC